LWRNWWNEDEQGKCRLVASGSTNYLTGTKVALGQVFSESFGFPCQSTFHPLPTIIFTITRGWHNRPGVAAVPIKGKGKVVPVLNLIKLYAMKAYGGVDV
jgi:hypothetical protein